jgi:hypothetical protein
VDNANNTEATAAWWGMGLMIDFPTYYFDQKNKTLKGYMGFGVNDSPLVVYGDGSSLGGAMGGGAATMLGVAYAPPIPRTGSRYARSLTTAPRR